MVKAQKRSKDIIKIVHVTCESYENYFCALRKLYLTILLLRVTVGAVMESSTMHACGAAEVEHTCAALVYEQMKAQA